MAKIGLKNLYYAKMNEDTAANGSTPGTTTYGAMKKIGNAISVDINPAVNRAALYGDDMAVATDTSLGEVEVAVETSDIPLEDQAILLGHTYDSVTGTMTSKSTDVAPYVGIAFESKKSDGGTRCTKLLKGKFAPSQETVNTKGENIEYQVPKLESAFVARQSDSAWKIEKDFTSGADTAEWYSSM